MKLQAENIKNNLGGSQIIFTDDLYNLYKSKEPGIKKTTVNWRIHELVENGVLQRVGRGKYIFGKENKYSPEVSTKEVKITKLIKKELPFINFCIWTLTNLNEFLQHQISFRFLVVEAEKESLESVYYTLQDNFSYVFKKPSKEIVEELISRQPNSIIINPLVSEAPIQFTKNVPTSSLEKLLVDLYCDKNLFYFLQGYELVNIFKNAFDKYTINQSKLLRYAGRRQKKMQMDKFIKSIFRQ